MRTLYVKSFNANLSYGYIVDKCFKTTQTYQIFVYLGFGRRDSKTPFINRVTKQLVPKDSPPSVIIIAERAERAVFSAE